MSVKERNENFKPIKFYEEALSISKEFTDKIAEQPEIYRLFQALTNHTAGTVQLWSPIKGPSGQICLVVPQANSASVCALLTSLQELEKVT